MHTDTPIKPRGILQASASIGAKTTLILFPVIEYADVWYDNRASLHRARSNISPDTEQQLRHYGFASYGTGFITSVPEREIPSCVDRLEQIFDIVYQSRSTQGIVPPVWLAQRGRPYRLLFRNRLYQMSHDSQPRELQTYPSPYPEQPKQSRSRSRRGGFTNDA